MLILPSLDVCAADRQVITEINPLFAGGRCQVTIQEVPEVAGGKFQACDETASDFDGFKLAVLRQMRRKATSFSVCFLSGYEPSEREFLSWWEQMDNDQDVPWLSNLWNAVQYRYSLTVSGRVSQLFYTVGYWHSQLQEDELETAVRDQVRQLLDDSMDMAAREKAIHDWIILHVTYDQSYQRHSDYDAFFQQSAVCQGYALLTDRMLAMAGVRDKIVLGSANGGDHAWNMVYLCGSWFQLDTTFDDPIGMPANYLRYNYFNVTDQQMSADHSWIWSDYPACQTAYIDGSCQEATGCSIFTPGWCNDEFQCINVSGTWKDGVCTVPGSDSGEEDTGDAELAAPLQDMVAMTFGTDQVYPEFTRVNVAAGPVRLQPKLAVDVRDRGKPASLFVYIYLPGSKGGFNFSGPRVVLDDEADFAPVFPDVLDFSRQSNLIFDVYYGYVLADGTIRYNAYEVLVDVLFW